VIFEKKAVKSVVTAAVESGATSFEKGRGGNCKPASPISLHTVPWEQSKKNQLADTSLLKRRSQGGRTSQGFTLVYWIPQEHKHTPTGREPREKSDGEPKERRGKQPAMHGNRLVTLVVSIIHHPNPAVSRSKCGAYVTMLTYFGQHPNLALSCSKSGSSHAPNEALSALRIRCARRSE
jgi:hypothetical protein